MFLLMKEGHIMRILLFSNSESLHDTVLMCQTRDVALTIECIKYNRIKSIALTSKDDLYIIDDDCLDEIDEAYLSCLKDIRAEVIVVVSNLHRLSHYIEFNVVEYFCGPISLVRMSSCIQRIYKRKDRLMQISEVKKIEHLVIKNKSEVSILDYDTICLMIEKSGVLRVHTCNQMYIIDDTIERLNQIIPDQFFRVDNNAIVNFDKVSGITKVSDEKYKIMFADIKPSVYLTDYMLKTHLEDEIKNNRHKYVVDTILENII